MRVDKKLVKNAIAVDAVFAQAAYQRAKELTGLENPGSVNQLKAWLADQDMPIESLARKIVQEKAAQTNGIVAELLAHALLTLEKNGYPVVFHVHDEAVIEMPIGQGALEEACRLMAIAPDWAKDLPLRADGYECAYYQKS